jgi:hypothetical protein
MTDGGGGKRRCGRKTAKNTSGAFIFGKICVNLHEFMLFPAGRKDKVLSVREMIVVKVRK